MTFDAPRNLEHLLTLDRVGQDRFVASVNEPNVGGEIFGGQYLGQSLAAALNTSGTMVPHAVKGWFLREASASRTLTFEVHRVRDGRRFAHRRVVVTQDQREVFHLDVSLRDMLDGPCHQLTMPATPSPADCVTLADVARSHRVAPGTKAKARVEGKRLIELRPFVSQPLTNAAGGEPKARAWVEILQPAFASAALRYAALAYLSDYWANTASRTLHCRTLFSDELTAVSLNHDIWFHQEPDLDGPLLFDLDSPATRGGTGLNRGLIYHRDGRLLASTAQEALVMRVPPELASDAEPRIAS